MRSSLSPREGDDGGTVDELLEGLGGEPDYVVVDFECLEVEALRVSGTVRRVHAGRARSVRRVGLSSSREPLGAAVVLLMAKNVRTGNVEIFERRVGGGGAAGERCRAKRRREDDL